MLLDIFKRDVVTEITNRLNEEGFKKDYLSEYLEVSISTINRWYNLERFPRPPKFKLLVDLLYDDISEFKLYEDAKLNEKLLLLRYFSGLSLEELSESIIISRTLLSNWENEKTLPSLTQRQRISLFYDIPKVNLGVPNTKVTVGTKVRQERMAMGLTQSELAKKLDISPSLISSYERDLNNIPDKALSLIAKSLEVCEEYLTSSEE